MTKLIDITGKALAGEWGNDDETGTGIPVLRTTNFTNEGIVNFDSVVTRLITKKNIKDKFLRPGDIIIEKSGGSDKQPVGRVVFYEGPENTFLFNNFTGVLRVKDRSKWYPRYVFYSLYSNYRRGGTRAFENKTTGLHNLKTDNYVSQFEVADANYSEQINICNFLDKVAGIIRARQKQLSSLDDLIKARFVETIVSGNATNKLGNFISSYKAERCGDRVIPVLSITKEDGIVFQDQKFKKRIASSDISTYKVIPRGKLVQGIHIDERNFAIQNITDEGIVSPAYKVWTVDNKKAIPEVLAYALRADYSMEYITSKFTGSVKRRESITTNDFLNLPINLPSLYIQEELFQYMKQADKSKAAIQKSLDETQTLFDSLMQQYFE